MRFVFAIVIGLFAGIAPAQNATNVMSQPRAGEATKAHKLELSALSTAKAKRSYALGMDLGRQLRNNLVEVDPDVFSRGLKDAFSGGNTLLTDEQARAAISELQAEIKAKIAESRKMGPEDNKRVGDAFQAENKKREGVVRLPDGLQYKILKAGSGPKPKADDTVICDYRGTLVSGVEFDSSYARGIPATFPVNSVVKGWTEALLLMPVGSKWQLVVPPELAFGEQGSGKIVGPNATVIFEVELISIQGKP